MKVLIAPNAFKHALSANEVAEAIAEGFYASKLDCDCALFPVGDGGTGTGELIVKHCGGITVHKLVQDPLGKEIQAAYGLIHDESVAVIDVASASGIHLLEDSSLDAFKTSTFGTGQLIMDALERGVRQFVIGVGGSATVDGGAGILQALGAGFSDVNAQCLGTNPSELRKLSQLDLSGIDERFMESEVKVLCDVDNVLFGEQGGVKMFAPQKGVAENDLASLEQIIRNYFNLLMDASLSRLEGLKGGGAAGGVAAGLYSLGNTELVDGITFFLELTGFKDQLQGVQLVVTGEGAIDVQTLQGKAPYGVAKIARENQVAVVALAGKRPLSIPKTLNDCFDGIFTIGNEPIALKEALKDTRANLFEAGRQMGNLLGMRMNCYNDIL